MKQKTQTTTEKVAYTGSIPNTPIRFLLHIVRPYSGRFFLMLLVVVIAQVLATSIPYILKKLVDALVASPSNEHILVSLKTWGGLYILAACIMFLFWRLSGMIGVYVLGYSKAYSTGLLYDYLVHHSHSYFSNRFAGSVSNKISHASDGADSLLENFAWHYFPSLLSLIGTNVLLYIAHPQIGITFTALVVTLFVLNIYLVKRRKPLIVAYANASSLLRGMGVDLVTNIAAVRHFTRYGFEKTRLGTYIDDRTKKDIKRDLSQELGLLINNLIVIGAIVIMVVVMYFATQRGSMTAGDVVLVITLLWETAYSLIFIGNMLNGFMRVYGEIEEGLQETLIGHEILDETNAQVLAVKDASISWKKVTFSYDRNTVFDTFNLNILPGERIGLVGSSGAGKTTFVSLLLRQHELKHGEILIDGQNIATVTQDSLRENVAVVPQEPMLFHRSIRENIAYGKLNATDSEITEVAKKAQAHEFVSSLPDAYETLVGERGVKLSGGQKQRIAIARAMLKNAPILVLDEATSALDSESEVAIQKALHELMVGKTVIAIAHRLSTLREMDRIIVLEKGKIVEDGTHTTLIEQNGIYARLWAHQAGGFLQD